jgi:hypothetical protein
VSFYKANDTDKLTKMQERFDNVRFARDLCRITELSDQETKQPPSDNRSTHTIYLEARSYCTWGALAKADLTGARHPRDEAVTPRRGCSCARVFKNATSTGTPGTRQAFPGEDAEKSSTKLSITMHGSVYHSLQLRSVPHSVSLHHPALCNSLRSRRLRDIVIFSLSPLARCQCPDTR